MIKITHNDTKSIALKWFSTFELIRDSFKNSFMVIFNFILHFTIQLGQLYIKNKN